MTLNLAPTQLVVGLPGSGRNWHLLENAVRRQRLLSDLRLYHPLTPEERLMRDVRRGGFPLLRKEACDPAPGKTIRGVTFTAHFPAPTSAGRMRP